MDTSRVLVAVILSLALIFAYQELVLKRLYPPPSETAQSSASPIVSPTAAGLPAPTVPTARVPAEALAGAERPERLIEIDTDLYDAEFTSRGARLKSLKLNRYGETAAKSSARYEMVPVSQNGRLPLGVLVVHGNDVADDHDLDYTTSSPDKIDLLSSSDSSITFTATTKTGEQIVKTFGFRRGLYAFDMNVAVSGPAKPDSIALALSQSLIPSASGFRDVPELQADIGGKVTTETLDKLKKGVAAVQGPVTFAGFGDRYFFSAYLPEQPKVATVSMTQEGDAGFVRLEFAGATELKSRVYMGPKLLEALETVDPQLNKAIDFGWLGILALPFLRVLKIFYLLVPNWGWDIILMTIALRIATLPMSIRGQRSMLKMQRLQPQMERLREKFKDDNERLQKEMVDLYKRNHVNPLGGCLPMGIQFPIFIGLYEALINAIDLRHAPFALWIKDLSAPDCLEISWMPQLPYIHCHGLPVLVLLMGASTFLQQWMSPTSPDPNQQRMMMLTPIIFTVMFVNFPAGLSLYYFASNVLGVIQQFVLNREFKQQPATI